MRVQSETQVLLLEFYSTFSYLSIKLGERKSTRRLDGEEQALMK